MTELPVVKVQHDADPAGYAIINVADFNAELHAPFDAEAAAVVGVALEPEAAPEAPKAPKGKAKPKAEE